MRVHKEGHRTLLVAFILMALIGGILWFALGGMALAIGLAVMLPFYIFILRFFRQPRRVIPCDNQKVYSPCDGRVVAIEEVHEPEYLNGRCIQVSIFMSVWNVHINWYPIAGRVAYYRYHPGRYLLAWHPKSSTENERTSVVVERADGTLVLVRQIAGFLARRVVCYAREGQPVGQCKPLGFIKFGSRVDLFLPLGTPVQVEIDQRVVGTKTVIAQLIG